MPQPVDNNVGEGFFLKHVSPTVACQEAIDPDVSGVMIVVDDEARLQMVEGFGGGVDGGKTSEAVISSSGVDVTRVDGEAKTPDHFTVKGIEIPDDEMMKLREIGLEVKRFFNEVLEPGKDHAVDMEIARQDGEWQVVQARVILIDE